MGRDVEPYEQTERGERELVLTSTSSSSTRGGGFKPAN